MREGEQPPNPSGISVWSSSSFPLLWWFRWGSTHCKVTLEDLRFHGGELTWLLGWCVEFPSEWKQEQEHLLHLSQRAKETRSWQLHSMLHWHCSLHTIYCLLLPLKIVWVGSTCMIQLILSHDLTVLHDSFSSSSNNKINRLILLLAVWWQNHLIFIQIHSSHV